MIYLDNAATSFPKAPGVPDAVARALESPLGNAGRPSSIAGLGAARVAFEAREALAALLGAPDARRLAFTKNATEALNIAIMGSVPPGGLLAMSGLEHNSVARPARRLELERGTRTIVFQCDERGRPDPESLDAAMAARPDLLVVSAASNVTGALLPFEDIVARCRSAGIPAVVDGSQAAGHLRIALCDTNPSAFCFPGHKGLLGPEGSGGLWLAEDFEPEPLLWGGTGSDSASELQPRALPDRYEAGTQNAAALAGLLAAASFLMNTGLERVEARESQLRDRLARGLAELPGLRLFGPQPGERSVPVLSLSVKGRSPADLALELGRRGVAVRPGLHCAPAAHRVLGTIESGGTLRLSPGFFTTDAEVDETLSIFEEILA
jgi:cysteine desulfurase / selenocysteine lyase